MSNNEEERKESAIEVQNNNPDLCLTIHHSNIDSAESKDNRWDTKMLEATVDQYNDCISTSEGFEKKANRYKWLFNVTQIVNICCNSIVSVFYIYPQFERELIIFSSLCAFTGIILLLSKWLENSISYKEASNQFGDLAEDINREISKHIKDRRDPYEYLAIITSRKNRILRALNLLTTNKKRKMTQISQMNQIETDNMDNVDKGLGPNTAMPKIAERTVIVNYHKKD
jgi:hypothetical protein